MFCILYYAFTLEKKYFRYSFTKSDNLIFKQERMLLVSGVTSSDPIKVRMFLSAFFFVFHGCWYPLCVLSTVERTGLGKRRTE
jgi:hypothetical protein